MILIKKSKILIPLAIATIGIGVVYFRGETQIITPIIAPNQILEIKQISPEILSRLKVKEGQPNTKIVEIGRTTDWKPIIAAYDLEYSFKDFTNRSSVNIPDNTIIYATMFLQEIPDSHIFPDKMTGVIFVNSNLDNVFIPEGNTVIGGSQRRFSIQNDLRDWLIDANNKPIEPLGKEYWVSEGYSIDPRDIPSKPLKDISEIKKI